MAIALTIALDLDIALQHNLARSTALDFSLLVAISMAFNYCERKGQIALANELKRLYQEITEFNGLSCPDDKQKWWHDEGKDWIGRLRSVAIRYRDIGHDWNFNFQQQQKLKQYYDANLLLVECLNRDCHVSRKARQEIEETLLLPIADIQRHEGSLLELV